MHSLVLLFLSPFSTLLITIYCRISSLSLTVCVSPSRTGTLLYTRQLSRATPTSSTCCFSTGPRPTSSPWSVHKHTGNHTHTHTNRDEAWFIQLNALCVFLWITSCWSVTGQNGNTALSIACRLGYISVVDTLRPMTDENLTTMVRHLNAHNLCHLSNNFQTDWRGLCGTSGLCWKSVVSLC